MEHKRVVLCGIPVLVVPEDPSERTLCTKCVFLTCIHCPTELEERSAGTSQCTMGDHYYVADPTPPAPIPTTTEDRAERLALDYHAELSKLGLTEHSHVLRILQSELGKRRTAALFKPK